MEWRPSKETYSEESWELYDNEIQIGYVDIVYTTKGRDKFIATFYPEDSNSQEEIQKYVFSIKDGKEFIEEQYLTYKMLGHAIPK